jgi:3-deoxy-D-manno-octulosonate 8-phosphate phosphatase (KDO 8-P phosphatase)
MLKLSYKQKLKKVTTLIFDVDGVITDGVLLMHPSGEFLRNMSTRDGYAIKKAAQSGLNVIIISGGESESMRKRLSFLDVTEIHMAVKDKVTVYRKLKSKYKFKNKEVLYMGDDLPDYEIMQEVGIATCPKDAVNEIKEISDYISHFKGGKGAVRDVIEQTLKIHKKWMNKTSIQAN